MKMTKKRVTAIALLLAMVLNLFSPYTNIVLAAPGTDIDSLPKPSVVLAINDYIESDGAIDVAIGLTGNYLGRGATVHVKWDKTKLTPATLGRKGYSETTSVVDWLTDGGTFHAAGDDSLTSWTVATTKSGWNLENGTAHIASADTSGKGVNPSLIKADAEWAEPAAKYNGFAPFIIFSFLVPDGMTSEEILTEGLIEIEYLDLIVGTEKANYYDLSLVNYDGLAEADEITGVEIKTVNGKEVPTDGTKLNVKYGENVEIGATILHSNADKNEEKTFTLGTDNEVAWKTGGNDLGNAEIELNYGEGDDAQTDTVAVNVQDYIKGITLNKETVEVDYGTELKNLGVTYQIEYGKAQKSTAKSITDGVTLTPNYDGTKSQKYTVTYTDTDDTLYKDETNTYSKELTVNLKDTITGVTITKVNGVSVTEGTTNSVPYQENATVEVSIEHSMNGTETKTYTVGTNNEVAWDVTPTNGLGNGQLSVTVGEETATVAVNVKDYVESITLNKESVTADKETELADLGVTYTVNYAKAGAKEAKSITDGVTINPAYDSSKSNQTLTVTYADNDENSYSNGKTFDKTLNVTLNEPADEITGVEIKKVNGIEVTEGSTTDIPYQANTTVEVLVKHSVEADETKTYTVGTNNEVAWDVTPTNGLGNGQLSVTVGEETATVAVNVKDYVESITLNKESVTADKETELADLGVTYTVNYAKAGAKEAKSITDGVTINPAYDSSKSNQTLTVTYTDNDGNSYSNGKTFDKTLNVTLNEKEIPEKVIGFTLNKTSVTADKGTELKDLGVTYTVNYLKTGEQAAKSITDGIVKISPAYDSNKESQTLTITYTDNTEGSETKGQDFTETLTITLNEKETPIDPPVEKDFVTGIKLNKTSVTGEIGDSWSDIAKGITYTVNYSKAGAKSPKSITDGIVKISPSYDSNKESQTLTITYTDNDAESSTNGQAFTETLSIKLNEKETPIDPPVEKDFVTGIKLNKTSVTGEIGDSWSDIAKGITYTVNYSKAGAKSPKSITDGIVKISPSYDSNKESQTLTITYTDNDAESSTNGQTFTTTLSIILNKKQIPVDPPVEKDYVTGIKLSKTSVTGEIGDSWSDIAKGITYTVNYSKAGAKSPKSITDGIVKISPSYDSNKESQTLTITYTDNDAESSTNGQTFTTTLSIKLNEKETPIEPVDPGDNKEDNQKPNDNKENNNNGNNNSNNNNGNNNSSNSNTTNNNSTTIIKYITTTTGPTETTSTDKEDEMKELEEKNKELEEKVNELEATIKEQKEEDKKDTDELPTATLGVQDKKDTSISDKLYLIGLLILATGMLALLLTRKNAKIYALVDGKERLIGKVKVHDENTMIDVNKYLNGDTYNKHIKVVLNKEISNKLDGKEIHIKYKDQTTKSKVNYADDNYKIDVK